MHGRFCICIQNRPPFSVCEYLVWTAFLAVNYNIKTLVFTWRIIPYIIVLVNFAYDLLFFLPYFAETYEVPEAKSFFELNYSCIYYLFHDGFTNVEVSLTQRGEWSGFILCYKNNPHLFYLAIIPGYPHKSRTSWDELRNGAASGFAELSGSWKQIDLQMSLLWKTFRLIANRLLSKLFHWLMKKRLLISWFGQLLLILYYHLLLLLLRTFV